MTRTACLLGLWGSLAALLLSSCVSNGTYKKLQDEANLNQETAKRKMADQDNLINDLQAKLGNATSNKAEVDRSLAETKQALNELSQRKAEMENELKEFRNLTDGLKSMIDTGSVKVQIVKGRMIVSLGSDVLFPSGSARLSSDGNNAVKQVAQQLTFIQGKDFQVEGHTDDIPIKTKEFRSNWELASARALNVVNEMISAGMPPERVSAASYADTRPQTSNDTTEGRAQNRRIDIVIIPDLSKLVDFSSLDRLSQNRENAGSAAESPQ